MFLNATGYGLVEAAIIAAAALGFNLIIAVSDVLNLGYVLMLVLGQFAVLEIGRGGVPFWPAVILGCILCGLIHIGYYFVFISPFQRKGQPSYVIILVSFAIFTAGVSLVTITFGPESFTYNLSAFYARTEHVGSFFYTNGEGLALVITAALVILMDVVLRFTRAGRIVRAVADDAALARVSGLSVSRIIIICWFVSGVIAAYAGVALGVVDVSFTSSSGSAFFVLVVAAAFVGGAGKALGAPLGGLVVGLVTEWSALFVPPVMTPLIAFGLLIAVIKIRPGGILGFIRSEMRA